MQYPVHMCTERNNQAKRISLLAEKGETIFHARDLARFWDINNRNTLYTVLKRYNQQKLIYRVFKGLYSLYPPEKLDKYLLGSRIINSYNYLSTETILFQHSIINQPPQYITFVSSRSRSFQALGNRYRCRSLKSSHLFRDSGLYQQNGLLMATPERAAADLTYFNPEYYFDSPHLLDRDKLEQIRKEVGYA